MALQKTDRVDAHIRIIDSAIVIDEIRVNNEPVSGELPQLLVLREAFNRYLKDYEADPARRK